MGKPRDAAVTSRIMAAVRGVNTEPERLLRSTLFRLGLRFRLHGKTLPGRPDIVFPSRRVAVFVDGDFWHGGGWQARGFTTFEGQFSGPKASFWTRKIQGNVDRDRRVNVALKDLGWRVIRIWESDIRKSPERCARRVHRVLKQRPRADR
jgi:DNA mismatch endonuclease (patch repair protein)